MSETKLFPPYLDQGSTGAAVNVLGLLLKVAQLETDHRIILDGEYTPHGAIAAAVMNFQRRAGFTAGDVEGNFGPKTRAKFLEIYGVDVDDLTVMMFSTPTVAKQP